MRRSWVGDERYAGAEIPDVAELRRQLRELLGRGPIPEDRRREVLAALTSTDAFETIAGQLEDPLDRGRGEPSS